MISEISTMRTGFGANPAISAELDYRRERLTEAVRAGRSRGLSLFFGRSRRDRIEDGTVVPVGSGPRRRRPARDAGRVPAQRRPDLDGLDEQGRASIGGDARAAG